MGVRNIVKIDPEKCNGCGLCVNACAEGAIAIVNGKARLVSENYCDGLGACLGHCPQGAITIEKRQAAEFNEEATKAHIAETRHSRTTEAFVCPGLMVEALRPRDDGEGAVGDVASQLSHWPIQLNLVPTTAPYFADVDLLLAADCVPFAMGDFHSRLLKGRSVLVGCPKLDDARFYIDKLAEILRSNRIKSLTVIHMEVPCCSGLTRIAREAISDSGVKMAFDDITVSLHGEVIKTKKIEAEGP